MNDSSNIYLYINCYQNPEGYYLDYNDSLYKECYMSCKSCEIKGDEGFHNCILCDPNYFYEFDLNNYTNCYHECKYHFYYNNKTKKYYCTEKEECPNELNKLIVSTNQCIEDCKIDDLYKYNFKNKCYSECPNNTEISEEINYHCIPICYKEQPFAKIELQECAGNCTINDLKNQKCRLSYNKSNIQFLYNYVKDEIENKYIE